MLPALVLDSFLAAEMGVTAPKNEVEAHNTALPPLCDSRDHAPKVIRLTPMLQVCY